MSVNGQPTIKYLTTWYRSLFKTRKPECARTLLWPDPHSLGLVSAWSEFRNRLSHNRRVQSCLGYVERRRRYSHSEVHARLPVMTFRYPRMTMATSCRKHTPFNKPLLMPSTSNVWSGIGGCRCYTPGYKHNHIDMSSSRVGKIHFAKVQSKQQLQQQQQQLEIENHLKPLAKQKRKLPKIRPIMRPRIVPKPKKKAPILTLDGRDDMDTLGVPQKRMEYMESTARTMGKHNYLVRNWQLNHSYSLPKLTWKPQRRTETTLTSVPLITYKHPEFNLPIRLPPMPKINLKQIQKKPETTETMEPVKTVKTVKTGKTVKTKAKAKKANKATKAKNAEKTKAEKSNEKETVLKSNELDGIKLLLGDLLNGKAPSLKQRKRDIEYGKTSPTFKMMAHCAERRSSLHNKQFVKQLENPIFFTHPLMRTQSLIPVQPRRTVSMAPKLTQHLEQRRNEQLNMRLNALLAASQYDEDVD